jgi:hypothetical protein
MAGSAPTEGDEHPGVADPLLLQPYARTVPILCNLYLLVPWDTEPCSWRWKIR